MNSQSLISIIDGCFSHQYIVQKQVLLGDSSLFTNDADVHPAVIQTVEVLYTMVNSKDYLHENGVIIHSNSGRDFWIIKTCENTYVVIDIDPTHDKEGPLAESIKGLSITNSFSQLNKLPNYENSFVAKFVDSMMLMDSALLKTYIECIPDLNLKQVSIVVDVKGKLDSPCDLKQVAANGNGFTYYSFPISLPKCNFRLPSHVDIEMSIGKNNDLTINQYRTTDSLDLLWFVCKYSRQYTDCIERIVDGMSEKELISIFKKTDSMSLSGFRWYYLTSFLNVLSNLHGQDNMLLPVKFYDKFIPLPKPAETVVSGVGEDSDVSEDTVEKKDEVVNSKEPVDSEKKNETVVSEEPAEGKDESVNSEVNEDDSLF